MRRSLGDALKNVPIDQFWSFKGKNGVQNWNLREKLSKISPFGNFDFWSKVNTKVKVNWSIVKVNGYWFRSVPGFWVGK